MNMKTVFGTVTIIALVSGTIYAIKKSRDARKLDEQAITLEDAQRIVAARPPETFEEEYGTYFEEDINVISKIIDEARIEAEYNANFYNANNDSEGGDEIEPTTFGDIEGDDELRYDPNSRDARNQFIKMELAEWVPLEDTYQTLSKLFEFPFNPLNDGDYDLMTTIIDFRVQFFGFESRWAKEVTYADVILHYARAAEFNCGESVRYWAEYFLDFNELDFTTSSHMVDEVLKNLNSHTYFNEERRTFGLFGLTRGCMDQAIKIANRNIDRSVTYEIEFNEFLKSCL